MAFLEINNLNKNFGKTEVLKGISFSLNEGEVLSVIGSSGSGKTTLLRCLNFLETPDIGEITLCGNTLFDGKNQKAETEKSLREKRLNFGLVFQSFNLFPQYTVEKNINLAPLLLLKKEIKEYNRSLKNNKVSTKERKQKVNAFKEVRKKEIHDYCISLLEKIGLSEKVSSYPFELSGGQQQRVAIARALALKPKILCFDEPTSALDPELTGEVLKVIRSLREEGRTMIIVSHEMGFVKNVSDKIIFMADGVAEEIGTPDEIFETPKSPKLVSFLSNVKDKENI